MLNIHEVVISDVHWDDPSAYNPCTAYFVFLCIEIFPAGTTISGTGDTYEHFHNWVNAHAHPWNIPQELTTQMWEIREEWRNPGHRKEVVISGKECDLLGCTDDVFNQFNDGPGTTLYLCRTHYEEFKKAKEGAY